MGYLSGERRKRRRDCVAIDVWRRPCDCVGHPELGEPDAGGRKVGRVGASYAGILGGLEHQNPEFWRDMANLDMNVILRKYCKGGKAA